MRVSVLSEAVQDRVNVLQTFGNLALRLGSGENDFAVHENEEDNSRLNHSIDQPWKQLWLVGRELPMHLI